LLKTQRSKLPWPTFFLAAINSAPVSIAQATLVRSEDVICATLSLIARVRSSSFMSAGATTTGVVAGGALIASIAVLLTGAADSPRRNAALDGLKSITNTVAQLDEWKVYFASAPPPFEGTGTDREQTCSVALRQQRVHRRDLVLGLRVSSRVLTIGAVVAPVKM
jgi:hypothetical protein